MLFGLFPDARRVEKRDVMRELLKDEYQHHFLDAEGRINLTEVEQAASIYLDLVTAINQRAAAMPRFAQIPNGTIDRDCLVSAIHQILVARASHDAVYLLQPQIGPR